MTNPTAAQTSAAAGSLSNQVVAMFDTYDHARAARDALVAAGIDRSRIELLGRSAAKEDTSFGYERNEQGFWAAVKNMFMPDDESHLYAEGINRGHAMLVVRGPIGEQDRIIGLLESQNPLDVETHGAQWRQSGWSGMYGGQATSGTAGRGGEEVIPVYQEQLRVGKREVDRGSVRVRSYVIETPVQEQVHLHEERVAVERRPVDRPMSPADAAGGAFKDRTIEVTATAEEAVVAKETRVKEEIVVRKEEEERTQTVSDTVRHTEVEVEKDRASAPAAATPGVIPTRRP